MELRPATAEETDDFGRAVMAAFHRELSDAQRELFPRLHEPERSLAWFDHGRIVANTSVFTRELTVPGGAAVPCAAVTAVGVAATHRRRGLLTGMMRRQLQDVRERGEPLAALYASEATIYGRFGYGIAARAAHLTARRPAARLRAADPPGEGAQLRAGPAAEHVEAMRAVHDRVRPLRPGMLDRPGPWWDDRLFDPEDERDGAQPVRAVVTEDGYALYAVRPDPADEDPPAGEVRVWELLAATPAAHARLWAFLLDQDLTSRLIWDLAPVDEPLWLALTDPRALRVVVMDALWVRLVDVAAALRARTYAVDPDVVIEVTDAFCPWNADRYRLAHGGCEATEAAADLSLDVADLGAAYLGGTTLLALAAAGRAEEHTPGALAHASAAFRGEVEPWCPEVF